MECIVIFSMIDMMALNQDLVSPGLKRTRSARSTGSCGTSSQCWAKARTSSLTML
jgi:hypothetical protein